jgi:hypothetical protein
MQIDEDKDFLAAWSLKVAFDVASGRSGQRPQSPPDFQEHQTTPHLHLPSSNGCQEFYFTAPGKLDPTTPDIMEKWLDLQILLAEHAAVLKLQDGQETVLYYHSNFLRQCW